MEVIRIAISGKMRSGKDTVASHLIKRCGFERMAFADKLKEVARDLFDIPPEEKCRALLIELSRQLCAMDPAVWLKYIVGRIPLHRSIVITDLRFPNEYHTLKGLGFCLIRLVIAKHVQAERVHRTEPDLSEAELELMRQDLSETALDGPEFKWDLTLDGGMGGPHLFNMVDLLLEHWTVERWRRM